jgi:dipeptidyl aminopeptidase/acylaminoacyl peptidase
VQIWSVDAGGGEPKALTDPSKVSIQPRCFAGGFIFDQVDKETGLHVLRADPGGGNPRRLNLPSAGESADVAKDGSFATVASFAKRALWAIPLNGGEPRSFGESTGIGKISKDGSKVLVSSLVTGADGLVTGKLQYHLAAGGVAVDLPNVPARAQSFDWSPDGSAVMYVDASSPVWNLFRAPLDGGKPQPVTSFDTGRVTAYEFSPDGRKLALTLTIGNASNVWLCGADGSKPVQVTRYPADDIFDLRWTHDGRLVVNAGKLKADAVLIKNFR